MDQQGVNVGLALGDQLLGGLDRRADLIRDEENWFHGDGHGPAWTDEASHLR